MKINDHHTPERLRWLRIQAWRLRRPDNEPPDWASVLLVASVAALVMMMVLP